MADWLYKISMMNVFHQFSTFSPHTFYIQKTDELQSKTENRKTLQENSTEYTEEPLLWIEDTMMTNRVYYLYFLSIE